MNELPPNITYMVKVPIESKVAHKKKDIPFLSMEQADTFFDVLNYRDINNVKRYKHSNNAHYIEEYLRKRFKENNKTTERKSVIEKLNSLKKNDFKTDIGKYPKAFTMHTNLPFVKDLQNSAISITNRAYDRKVKINNLKEMANTIMYIEEHGIENRDALNDSFDESRHRTSDARSALKRSEDGITGLNEQIHYTGQYLANKGTYQAFLKSKNKGRFRSEHESEIIIYEAARRHLKEQADNGTLPSLKYIKSAPGKFVSLDRLKAKRSELISKQKKLRTRYYSAKNAEKEMYAIKRNVDNILRQPSLNAEKAIYK